MAAVMGATILIGGIFVIINRLSDILYGVLDARSRSR
jgi:peptide/nickel transport system permease protein